MNIKYLGHSCFLIQSSQGISILTDPYKSGAYGGALTYAPIIDAADIVTLSHEHEDHAELNSLPNQPLVVRAECRAMGVEFDVVNTFHDSLQGQERGSNRAILFTLDGMRVCHLGDLGHILSPEQVEQFGKIDILLVPVGGRFTIDPQEATQVTAQLNPRIAIPMHYKTTKCGFPIEGVEAFLVEKDRIKQSPTAEVTIDQVDLPKEFTVLVIPPGN